MRQLTLFHRSVFFFSKHIFRRRVVATPSNTECHVTLNLLLMYICIIYLVRHRQLKFLGHILQMSKGLLEDILCTSQPLAKGDLVDHVLHSLPIHTDCLGIMKEQCKNSRLPHLLMIVVHGETLWSPAPQPMDDDVDDDDTCWRELYSSIFFFKNWLKTQQSIKCFLKVDL